MLLNFLIIIIAYLIGSLSFAVIVSRLLGMADPRSYGSGNPGATNVLRSGRKTAAALTLLGDALKGLVAVSLARLLIEPLGLNESIVAYVAVAALIGHMWPIFFSFKGGKGVATALGVLIGLSWPVALICGGIWLIIAFGFKVSSLAALIATITSPLIAWWIMPYSSWVIATLIIAVLVLYRHKSNITNLLHGKESKIGDKVE